MAAGLARTAALANRRALMMDEEMGRMQLLDCRKLCWLLNSDNRRVRVPRPHAYITSFGDPDIFRSMQRISRRLHIKFAVVCPKLPDEACDQLMLRRSAVAEKEEINHSNKITEIPEYP